VAKSTDLFLCYDLGGTKLRAALVTTKGRIVAHSTGEVNQRAGFDGLMELFRELSVKMEAKKFKAVSVAAAGPLHPAKGILLDPTNFFTDQKSWGVVSLVAPLKKIFKKPVYLENDAAAAVLGERWKGGHGKASNIVAMTLGTGVGVGVIANDILVRAGRGLHPEGGHIPINSEDKNFPCGCGAYGCVEAYLAGSHFAKRMSARIGRSLTGREAVTLARDGDFQLQASFKEYGRHLAQAIRTLCVLFAPEVVVLSGGFSHASGLFLKETEKVLPGLMERYRDGIDLVPKVKVSKLQDDAGILGAAYLAMNK
jgi:glucokinase